MLKNNLNLTDDESRENSLKEFEELRIAAKPLVEYMHSKCCPMDIVLVQFDRVEVFNGLRGIPFEVPD